MEKNRETWLRSAVDLMRPYVKERAGVDVPEGLWCSVGFPVTGARSTSGRGAIGECHYATADGVPNLGTGRGTYPLDLLHYRSARARRRTHLVEPLTRHPHRVLVPRAGHLEHPRGLLFPSGRGDRRVGVVSEVGKPSRDSVRKVRTFLDDGRGGLAGQPDGPDGACKRGPVPGPYR